MRARARRAGRRLGRLDRKLLARAVARRSPAGDLVMTGASTAANHSVLWLAVAGGLAATGRRRPRTAAASGLLGIGIAATLVNGPLKFAWRRDRPPTAGPLPLLPLPRTFSFPSGHSASAFAFGTGVSVALPAAAPAVLPAAAAVAYSRVYTGVHYPSDVAVGAVIGAGSGLVAAGVVRRLRARALHPPAAATLPRRVPLRAVLVTSKHAGSANGLDLARRELIAAGVQIVREVPVAEVDAIAGELAVDEPPLLIAAGGDGTVCAVANVAHDSGALLAVLPLGTSNDVARSLGIPPDPCEAARVIAAGRPAAVDAGQVCIGEQEPRLFLNAVTAGLNVRFAKEATDPSLRARFGALTYPVAAARAVRSAEPFECVIEEDGETRTYRAVHVSVSNAPVFGGLLGMRVPGASITDGLLDVIVMERLSLFRTALAAVGNAVGRHRPVHRVHTLRTRQLRVQAADREELAMDGEVIGALPAEFAALPGQLHVVLPVDTDS